MRRKSVVPLILKNCGQTMGRFRISVIFCVGNRFHGMVTYVLLSDRFMRKITMAPIRKK